MNAIALTISEISIRQDAEGRFCLNDLHKASGGESKHQPSNWLRLDSTKEIIAELDRSSDLMSVEVIQGGKVQGTFGVKEIMYSYAMWISAKFHIAVIRAYDALVTTPVSLPEPKTKKSLPGKLTLSMQDEIKALVKERAEALPKEKRAKATITMWSAIKSKYGCSYKEVDEDQFAAVVGLLARLPIEGELVKKPKQEPPYPDGSIEARKHIDHLRQAMLTGMDEIILNEAMEELNKIERCIISAWTHMDESLMRLHTCVSMLSRWRGAQ